jgi:hypothetical protein
MLVSQRIALWSICQAELQIHTTTIRKFLILIRNEINLQLVAACGEAQCHSHISSVASQVSRQNWPHQVWLEALVESAC